MLAADCVETTPDDAVATAPLIPSDPTEADVVSLNETNVTLQLPSDLPASFTVSLPVDGATLTLDLRKNSVFGQNTRFLVDDGSGSLVQIDHGPDRSYLGGVAEHPGYTVTGWLSEDGLIANIARPYQETIQIQPLEGSSGNSLHTISLNNSGDYQEVDNSDVVFGANVGVLATLRDQGGVSIGQAELKHHDDKGDLELWLYSEDGVSPLDLPADTPVTLTFNNVNGNADRDGTAITLAVRDFVRNEDEDGNANLREGNLTNYFISPSGEGYDASWLQGGAFVADVSISFEVDGQASQSDEFRLIPHTYAEGHSHTHSHDQGEDGEVVPEATTTPIITDRIGGQADTVLASSSATLPPPQVSNVYQYEIGVEIGSAAFLNNYGSDLNLVQSVVAGLPLNLDARFLHSAGIKHVLGTVIIRQSAAEEPFSVANGNDTAGLNAFRDYWNNNPQEVGNTHDLAVYHVRSAPSGLAWVNQVGTNLRYLLAANNGATSWADGVSAHEVGHQWNLNHVPSNPDFTFYESRPRSNGNAAGGEERFISIMHGSGTHNIGRLSSGEADRAHAARNNKLNFGDLITDPNEIGNVKPFGYVDQAITTGDPILIDVIANDYDVNNDVLNVELRDTVSLNGATISLSVGTGPGGRDQILYTPAPGQQAGFDFFHYNVVDSTGLRDFGAVYVDFQGPLTVNLGQDSYAYDFGTPDSPVFDDGVTQAVAITPATTGDIVWGGPVQAVDRSDSGQNAYNRDLVYASAPVEWSHKIQNGRWRVTVNMSDPDTNLDNMFVMAEGAIGLSDLDRPIGQNQTVSFEVEVLDGELDLVFGDADSTNPLWALNRVVLTQLEAYIPPVLEGDYNNDGLVNAADYTIYRDTLSQAVDSPYDGADGDGSSVIDTDDHSVWAVNYGAELVTSALIDATTGNGEVAVDDENDVSLFGGGSDTATIVLTRDRAFRSVGASGRGISIDGWDIERILYQGSNAAYGADGLYGFAPDAGTGPGQTGQFFVNSGVIEIRSDPVARDFQAGEQINLSYLLGSDSNGASETVEATAELVFDEGLSTERTHSFPVRSATGLSTPAITEEYRIPLAASTLSVHFTLDGVQVGIRALLDQVELDWTRSTANAAPSNLVEAAALSATATPEDDSAGEQIEQIAGEKLIVAPILTRTNGFASTSSRRDAALMPSASDAGVRLDQLLLYGPAAPAAESSEIDFSGSDDETAPSQEDRDSAFESLDLSVI